MKFADTSWWVSWSLPGDARHADALAMLKRVGPTEQVLTTNLILGEAWTFLRRKAGHRTAVGFLDRVVLLESGRNLAVHRVTEEEEIKAWAWLRQHDERVYSLVDASSFEIMRIRRLREALAFDQDFAVAGFIELRP